MASAPTNMGPLTSPYGLSFFVQGEEEPSPVSSEPPKIQGPSGGLYEVAATPKIVPDSLKAIKPKNPLNIGYSLQSELDTQPGNPTKDKPQEREFKINIDKCEAPQKVKKNKSDKEVAKIGMLRNLRKALLENIDSAKDPQDKRAFITSETLEEIIRNEKVYPPLSPACTIQTDLGEGREWNEDVQFVEKISLDGKEIGTLAGVLDGHSKNTRNGKTVANFVKSSFPDFFARKLVETNHNIVLAFERTFAEVQSAIKSFLPTIEAGTTAAVVYVEYATNQAYAATLGDSKAMISRKINGEWKLIPLSLVRDWRSDKDSERAAGTGKTSLLFNSPNPRTSIRITAEQIRKNKSLAAKDIRIFSSDELRQLNISRALGDFEYFHEGRGIMQKIKVTQFPLAPGDRLMVVSDGVTDFLGPDEVLDQVLPSSDDFDLAYNLIKAAKGKMTKKNGDNISAVAIYVDFPSTDDEASDEALEEEFHERLEENE